LPTPLSPMHNTLKRQSYLSFRVEAIARLCETVETKHCGYVETTVEILNERLQTVGVIKGRDNIKPAPSCDTGFKVRSFVLRPAIRSNDVKIFDEAI